MKETKKVRLLTCDEDGADQGPRGELPSARSQTSLTEVGHALQTMSAPKERKPFIPVKLGA